MLCIILLQVLFCSFSNVAVDFVLVKLAKCGERVLRIGNPLRTSDDAMEYSLASIVNSRLAEDPSKTEAAEKQNVIMEHSVSYKRFI